MRTTKLETAKENNGASFIDLFCGCGGFTLGMLRAGFQCRAAIDFNTQAVETLRKNLLGANARDFAPVANILEKDLTKFPPADLSALIGVEPIDVIVGGPPCQGFSTARQRDGSNHGKDRLKDDPRRHLYRQFLDFVEYFQPKLFVIENVLGLRSAAGGRYFTAVQHEARILGRDNGRPGYRVHAQIEEGVRLGVPQKRRRQLIIGVRADLPGYFSSELQPAKRAVIGAMLGDAIGDLPSLAAGEGEHVAEYDIDRREVSYLRGMRDRIRREFLKQVAEVDQAPNLTDHVSRPHSARDLRDFSLLKEGENAAVAARRGAVFEFPYDKSSFKDRYTRQHRNRPCSTIVAHLSKDGLMFIHPTQNRSLTPREAARVQSFPDWFMFPKARTHAFRMIGNAVPPLVAEAVGVCASRFLHAQITVADNASKGSRIPCSAEDASARLNKLMYADRNQLRNLDRSTFLAGWQSLLWLFPGLHPDNALDHGHDQVAWPEAETVLPLLDADHRHIFMRSGWPVALEAIGAEAWRRRNSNELSHEELYCIVAHKAGLAAIRKDVDPPIKERPKQGGPNA